MVGAAENHISPYALNQEEYLRITEEIQKSTGIEITPDMNQIEMKAASFNNSLNLIFHVPIIDQEQLFKREHVLSIFF